jgi:hypothetical protein
MKQNVMGFFVAVALFAGAGVASAADFTFNVPINIQNAHPDIRQGTVFCRVFKVRGNHTAENEVADSRHETGLSIPFDSSGNYRGTLAVPVTTQPGKNPADGRYYECDLMFNGFSLDSDTRARGAAFESRAGSARTVHVSGDIPR